MRSTQRPDPAAPRDDAQQALFDYGPGTVSKKYDFRAQWFEQPLDHFDKSSKHKFHQRYWVNSRHYKPREGAPVIVLDGGETSGEVCLNSDCIDRLLTPSQDRLPFLDTGIVEILARATGGLGVVLEHRYYGAFRLLLFSLEITDFDCLGESIPVSNFSTDALR